MNNIQLELSVDDTNLVLEALGQLPFIRVYGLIGRIQDQAQKQIQAASESNEKRNGNGALSRQPSHD